MEEIVIILLGTLVAMRFLSFLTALLSGRPAVAFGVAVAIMCLINAMSMGTGHGKPF